MNKIATEFDALVLDFSQIMVNQQVEVVVRMQAAQELMTVVYSHKDRWLQLLEDTRAAIKAHGWFLNLFFSNLHSAWENSEIKPWFGMNCKWTDFEHVEILLFIFSIKNILK